MTRSQTMLLMCSSVLGLFALGLTLSSVPAEQRSRFRTEAAASLPLQTPDIALARGLRSVIATEAVLMKVSASRARN